MIYHVWVKVQIYLGTRGVVHVLEGVEIALQLTIKLQHGRTRTQQNANVIPGIHESHIRFATCKKKRPREKIQK